MIVSCDWCGKENVIYGAARKAADHHFCNFACRGAWRAVHWLGENHPRWTSDEPREKFCEHCGKLFRWEELRLPLSTWRKRKFCSRECVKVGQKRLYGADHPLYKTGSRLKSERGRHGAWARAVISRDHATCQQCGTTGVELHAHHIKSFEEYPDLRRELSNGVTLCFRCHWAVHAAPNANGVNSGNIRPGDAEDNPEPSDGRKSVEGVTTRGRAYRRWEGQCEECGAFISKRWSDAIGKAHLFCSKSCRSKFHVKNGIIHGLRNQRPATTAVIASTSAPPERDDIV